MAKEIILGIGGLEHNSAASLMVDGNIIAAAEEERFNRIKHYKGFPEQSVRFCLDEAGVSLSEVTEIAVGEVISESYAKRRDYIKIESSNRSFVYAQPSKPVSVYLPAGCGGNFVADDENLGKIERIEEFARQCPKTKNIRWVPHHIAHGASSFYTHNLQESAYLSVDYLGEFETIVCGKFTGNNYFNYYSIDYPHSLGFLYSAITRYLGFSSQSDEYKIMGLASYGKPIYINDMRRLVNLKGDGKLELDIDYFNIGGSVCSEKSVSDKFISLFGISRQPHDPYTQKHADIASSLQRLIKESVIISRDTLKAYPAVITCVIPANLR